MVLGIKLLLLLFAIVYFIVGCRGKNETDKLHYHISSDIFVVGLLLAILISSLK